MSEIKYGNYFCKCCGKHFKAIQTVDERTLTAPKICGECAEYYKQTVQKVFAYLFGILTGISFCLIFEGSKLRGLIMGIALFVVLFLYILFIIILKRKGKNKVYTEEEAEKLRAN